MASPRLPVGFAQVSSFDGHKLIVSPSQPCDLERVYELDRYLGGGSAGVVYEATHASNGQSFAVKIITPIPYKLQSQAALKRCHVAVRGTPAEALEQKGRLEWSDLWWLYEPYTREVIPAVADSRGALKELTLGKSVALWGLHPPEAAGYLNTNSNADRSAHLAAAAAANEHSIVCLQGTNVRIPHVPLKYISFLRARANIYKEIHAMAVISPHPNVLSLHEVLEYVQDSKATFFLVMDLASGGELLEYIRGTGGVCSESRAKAYMRQLLSGVKHCHSHGVAHRDLKPENLLLAARDDERGSPVLVIADFGLSAVMSAMEATANVLAPGTPPLAPTSTPGADISASGSSSRSLTVVTALSMTSPPTRSVTGGSDAVLLHPSVAALQDSHPAPGSPVSAALAGEAGARFIPGPARPSTPTFILDGGASTPVDMSIPFESAGASKQRAHSAAEDSDGGGSGMRSPSGSMRSSSRHRGGSRARTRTMQEPVVPGTPRTLFAEAERHFVSPSHVVARAMANATPTAGSTPPHLYSPPDASAAAGGRSAANPSPAPIMGGSAAGAARMLASTPGGVSFPMRRLKSVCGSPFYCAPEVVNAATSADGYDGAKADAWSVGVVMHAILAGSLPFSEHLSSCVRYQKFAAWVRERDDAIASALSAHAQYQAEVDRQEQEHANARAMRRQHRRAARGAKVKPSTDVPSQRAPGARASHMIGADATSEYSASDGVSLVVDTALQQSPLMASPQRVQLDGRAQELATLSLQQRDDTMTQTPDRRQRSMNPRATQLPPAVPRGPEQSRSDQDKGSALPTMLPGGVPTLMNHRSAFTDVTSPLPGGRRDGSFSGGQSPGGRPITVLGMLSTHHSGMSPGSTHSGGMGAASSGGAPICSPHAHPQAHCSSPGSTARTLEGNAGASLAGSVAAAQAMARAHPDASATSGRRGSRVSTGGTASGTASSRHARNPSAAGGPAGAEVACASTGGSSAARACARDEQVARELQLQMDHEAASELQHSFVQHDNVPPPHFRDDKVTPPTRPPATEALHHPVQSPIVSTRELNLSSLHPGAVSDGEDVLDLVTYDVVNDAEALEAQGAHPQSPHASEDVADCAHASSGDESSSSQTAGAGSGAPVAPPPLSAAPIPYPAWFFPAHMTDAQKDLMAGLLHPDPAKRMSIDDALRCAWLQLSPAARNVEEEVGAL